MNAKEFNDLTESYFKDAMDGMGFKKSGTHFYLHESPNVLIFHKKTFRSSFEGFYCAATFDFMDNVSDSRGKFKVPGYIEHIPISIAMRVLRQQYEKFSSAFDFDCDLNFATRERTTMSQFSPPPESFVYLMDDDKKAEDYIKFSIDVLKNEGMRFFKECSPLLAFKSMTKFAGHNIIGNWGLMADLERYMTRKKIDVTKEALGASAQEVASGLNHLASALSKTPEDIELFRLRAAQVLAIK